MTDLERNLQALAHEAVQMANALACVRSNARSAVIEWGMLALNGWMSDVRESAMREQGLAQGAHPDARGGQ